MSLSKGIRYFVSSEPISAQKLKDIAGFNLKSSPQEIFSIGYSKNYVLTHIPLEFSGKGEELFYLTLDFPSIDRIEFRIFDSATGQPTYHTITGDSFPFAQRPIASEVFVFPIKKPAEVTNLDIVLVTQSTGSHKLPFLLETPEVFQARISGKYFIWGIFIGLIFTFFLVSLVFFIFTRNLAILFFVLYTFSLIWVFLSGFGLGFRYIFQDYVILQNNLFIIISSSSVCFKIFFYIHFLKCKSFFPRYFNYLIFIVFLFVVSTIGYLITGVTEFYTIVLLLGPITILSLIILSTRSLKYNHHARYFLLAEVILFIGVLISMLTMIGIIPHNNITYQIFLWTVGLELFILSIAIGRLIYSIRLEKEAAEAGSFAKGIFLSTMSHEIRTPLSGVLGFLELLETTELDDTQKEYVKIARSSGKSLLHLINDILDFSKIEAGKLELHPEKVPILDLVQESCKSIIPMVKKKGIFLDIKNDDIPHFFYVDVERLKQVLINLLGNAVKFTEKGSVTLSIEFRELKLDEGVFSFRVIDTGIGIKADEISRLFKVFTQAESGARRRYEGTGLGLAITESLVKGMGGSMKVESKYGKGSVFSFDITTNFWRIDESSNDSHENMKSYISDDSIHKKEGITPSAIHKIIIADDDTSNLFIAKKMVEKILPGVQIWEAKNGIEVLNILRKESIQLILMDVQMPEMDGLEATKKIRNSHNPMMQNIPIIGLSANAYQEEVDLALSSGMNDYITKPIEKEKLRRILDSYK
ncbi:MAG: response regulator [Leptospira sp.]|nr:response regulator [Leptospira sp.]